MGKGNFGEEFPEEPLKNGVHAALEGIFRMIEELKFYNNVNAKHILCFINVSQKLKQFMG